MQAWTLVACAAAVLSLAVAQGPGRFLSQPNPQKCANKRISGWRIIGTGIVMVTVLLDFTKRKYDGPLKFQARRPKEFTYNGHNYFYSAHIAELAEKKFDWLDGRNLCREFCMDLVSIETQEKNNLIFKLIQQNDIPYIWTSGRLCDFKGCEGRKDLEPKNILGWFWSATREKISPTNKIPEGWGYNPWSQTGHKKVPQPDNAEFDINQTTESCLSVLNNVYNDGIAWHDVACYHEKPVLCEDNDELLNYIASTNSSLKL